MNMTIFILLPMLIIDVVGYLPDLKNDEDNFLKLIQNL